MVVGCNFNNSRRHISRSKLFQLVEINSCLLVIYSGCREGWVDSESREGCNLLFGANLSELLAINGSHSEQSLVFFSESFVATLNSLRHSISFFVKVHNRDSLYPVLKDLGIKILIVEDVHI
jgi:hypothetical protein